METIELTPRLLHELINQAVANKLKDDDNRIKDGTIYQLISYTGFNHQDDSSQYHWVLGLTPKANYLSTNDPSYPITREKDFYTSLFQYIQLGFEHFNYRTIPNIEDEVLTICISQYGDLLTMATSDNQIYISLLYSGKY